MWVEKQPLPDDFCGCPPCPLCYVWTDGDHPTPLDAIEKQALDLLGRKPTPAERKKLREAAERVHVGNLKPRKERVNIAKAAEAFDLTDQQQWMHRRITALAADRRKQAAMPKKDRRPVLDQMDFTQPVVEVQPENQPFAVEAATLSYTAVNPDVERIKAEMAQMREEARMSQRRTKELLYRMRKDPFSRY
jgi:glycerol-3-phosphate cytidylyltransferase-like family protein